MQSGYAVNMQDSEFFRVDSLSDDQFDHLIWLMQLLNHSVFEILSCIGPHRRRAEIEARLKKDSDDETRPAN